MSIKWALSRGTAAHYGKWDLASAAAYSSNTVQEGDKKKKINMQRRCVNRKEVVGREKRANKTNKEETHLESPLLLDVIFPLGGDEGRASLFITVKTGQQGGGGTVVVGRVCTKWQHSCPPHTWSCFINLVRWDTPSLCRRACCATDEMKRTWEDHLVLPEAEPEGSEFSVGGEREMMCAEFIHNNNCMYNLYHPLRIFFFFLNPCLMCHIYSFSKLKVLIIIKEFVLFIRRESRQSQTDTCIIGTQSQQLR